MKWTDERIDAAVAELLDSLGRRRYPRQCDFADAGLSGLCRTIRSRPGGTQAIVARMGCLPPLRWRLPASPTPRSTTTRKGTRA